MGDYIDRVDYFDMEIEMESLDNRLPPEVLSPTSTQLTPTVSSSEEPIQKESPPKESPNSASEGPITSTSKASPSLESTKTLTRSDKSPALKIFPRCEDSTLGLKNLIEAANISAEDLKMDEEKWLDALCNAVSNWETILEAMLPKGEAEEVKQRKYSQVECR